MSKKPKATPTIPAAAPVELKLDLGCGRNKQPGFIGVDLYCEEADVKCNLFHPPFLPIDKFHPVIPSSDTKPLWEDNSVSEIFCSHFVEHIPNRIRWPFFEECWRILKPEGTMRIFVPNWKSERAYGDMTHEWPPVTAMFFLYLNRGWMDANKLTYGPYALRCNFDHQAGPTSIRGGFAGRSHETQMFALAHYMETYDDMWVTLIKKPMP